MEILAIITLDKERVFGGAPIFYCQSKNEAETVGQDLARILAAALHQLETGDLLVVRH